VAAAIVAVTVVVVECCSEVKILAEDWVILKKGREE
jgi:hypothetical protein